MVRLRRRSPSIRALVIDAQGRWLNRGRSVSRTAALAKRYALARLRFSDGRLGFPRVQRGKRPTMRTVVINLPSRKDRKALTNKSLNRVGVDFDFIPGVVHPIPLAGCAQAHANAIRTWKSDASDLLMVCEDDADFLVNGDVLEDLIWEFARNPALDVLALGNSTRGRLLRISLNLSITDHTQTASCYVLKKSAAAALTELFEFSRRMLEQGEPETIYAHDILWIELQRSSKIFAVPNKRAVRQAPSYSDIQKNFVDYGL